MLKIGIIGFSEGNGHPYSWSAIFNGYNPEKMAAAGFPRISAYLGQRKWPQDQIKDCRVTHVWTQDETLSQRIAEASLIPRIVKEYTALIGEVDAVIIARDDYVKNWGISRPFIEAGLPVFIDKPLAVSVAEATRILEQEKYQGQVFTCTALRYAAELMPQQNEIADLGPLTRIEGSTPKSWDKYAIHIIEPVIAFMNGKSEITGTRRSKKGQSVTLDATWKNGLITSFTALGPEAKEGAISLTFYGKNGSVTKRFEDSFSAFKTTLLQFTEAARTRRRLIPREETIGTIRLVEAGLADDIR